MSLPITDATGREPYATQRHDAQVFVDMCKQFGMSDKNSYSESLVLGRYQFILKLLDEREEMAERIEELEEQLAKVKKSGLRAGVIYGGKIIRAVREGRGDIFDAYANHWASECEREGDELAARLLNAAISGETEKVVRIQPIGEFRPVETQEPNPHAK